MNLNVNPTDDVVVDGRGATEDRTVRTFVEVKVGRSGHVQVNVNALGA